MILVFYHQIPVRGVPITGTPHFDTTPIFACFPVCLQFATLTIIAAVVVIFGLANRSPMTTDQPGFPAEVYQQNTSVTGQLPTWVIVLMALLALVGVRVDVVWVE